MSTTLTFSDTIILITDKTKATVKVEGVATEATIIFKIDNDEPRYWKSINIPYKEFDGVYSIFEKDIFGYELGYIDYKSVKMVVYDDLNGRTEMTDNLTISASSDPFDPIVTFLIDMLKSDSVLRTFALTFNRFRNPIIYMGEIPAIYVYFADARMIPNIGSKHHEYVGSLMIEFVEDIRGRKQANDIKHREFSRRICDYFAANPRLNGNLHVNNSRINTVDFPWSSQSSQFLISTSIDIDIRIYPYEV